MQTTAGTKAANGDIATDNRPLVAYVEINEARAGQRLDNFLRSHLKGVPKSRIYRILRKGEVRVNKGRAKPATRLQLGDMIRIPPLRTASKNEPMRLSPQMRCLDTQILLEDSSLLILNKPCGIAVHGGSGISGGVIEALRIIRPDYGFLELAHRLDKDTSGCLVLAKTRQVLLHFQNQLRSGQVKKHYSALVAGVWRGGTKNIDVPLERAQGQTSRDSLSIFRPVEIFAPADVSLMDIHLVTGRMHQARKHASLSGHPVLGDKKYGDKEAHAKTRQAGLKRLFLHAHSLRFAHPGNGKTIMVEAPLPDDLTTVLNQLRHSPSLIAKINI